MSDITLFRNQGHVEIVIRETTWRVVRTPISDGEICALASQPDQAFGAVGRELLETGLAENAATELKKLRGHFVIIAWQGDRTVIVTDCGGTVGCYQGQAQGLLAIGTNVDSIGAAISAAVDEASAHDFLMNGSICHPFTWYKGVSSVNPASVRFFKLEKEISSLYYWTPTDDYLPDDQSVKLISEEFPRSVASCLKGQRDVSLFYSGGDDSRTLAACIPKGISRKGYIFIDEKNREYGISKLSARILGFRIEPLFREHGYYIRDVPSLLRHVGNGQEIQQAHSFYFRERLPIGVPVLGGWTADTFLKGIYATRTADAEGNLSAVRRGEVTPRGLFLGPFGETIKRRHANWIREIARYMPGLAYEWKRFWPVCQHEHYGHFACSRRLYDMHEPFMSSEMVQIWAKVRPEAKVDGSIYRRALGSKLGFAGYLPRTGGTILRLNSKWNKRVQPLMQMAFILTDRFLYKSARAGAWTKAFSGPKVALRNARRRVEEEIAKLDPNFVASWYGGVAIGTIARRNGLNPMRLLQISHSREMQHQEEENRSVDKKPTNFNNHAESDK